MEIPSFLPVWQLITDLASSMLSWPPAGIALFWFVCLLSLWLLYRLVKTTIRVATALYYTAIHRLRSWLAGIKTWIVCRFRRRSTRPGAMEVREGPFLEFDETDLAVLRLAASQGPGQTVSAPDVAERLSMRTAKVQRHLDQLGHGKILERVIGSTDGFTNYRLTAYGTAFLANITRQAEISTS